MTSSDKPAKKTAAKKASGVKALGTTGAEYKASGRGAPQPPAAGEAQPVNPAQALLMAAQQAAVRQGGNVAAHATGSQVAQSKPVRLEVKINGKTRYAKQVYDPQFDEGAETLTITADLQPTMVEPAPLPPPTRFYDQSDPRDGEDLIMRVHTGRRDVADAGISGDAP